MAYQLHQIDNQLHGIRVDTARGVDNIQNYATSRANVEAVDTYEKALMHRTSNLKSDINGQLDNLHQHVTSKRPSPNDINYEQKRKQYHELLVHANDGLGSIGGVFAELFSKLIEVIKKIVKWIVDHLPQIVIAIVKVFATVILPLLGVM